MSGFNDALFYLDLDKGKETSHEDQVRLRTDRRVRAGWTQYQALRALALETAPSPTPKMLRAVVSQCRREHVGRQLSEIAGGDDLARELLLAGPQKSRGKNPWILGVLLAGSLGLGWAVFQGNWADILPSIHGKRAGTNALGSLLGRQDPVPFEFPVQSPPPEAALSGPGDGPSTTDADDVHSEAPAARQASRLLREHLHEAQAREQDPEKEEPAPSDTPSTSEDKSDAINPVTDSIPEAETNPHLADPKKSAEPNGMASASSVAVPKIGNALDQTDPTATLPLPVAEPSPSNLSSLTTRQTSRSRPSSKMSAPSPTVNSAPIGATASASKARVMASKDITNTAAQNRSMAADPSPTTGALAPSPGMTLSSNTLIASANTASDRSSPNTASSPNGNGVDVAISMPQRRGIDIRLFNPDGRSTRVLATGDFGPGLLHFALAAVDDQGQILAPGMYYLRVMTPWFSRVEPIQIH